eukprot:142689_1
MGTNACCCQSDSEEQRKLEQKKIKIPQEITITPKMKKAIKKIKLRKTELIFLWKCFIKIGITEPPKVKKTSENTYITKFILSSYLQQPFNIFYSNLFDRWDLDRNDKVTFDELLIGLYKFLLSKPSKYVEYIFETYDSDGDGYLMGNELSQLLEELHGTKQLHAMSAKTAMGCYDRKNDGKIDLTEFEEAILNYPLLMWNVTLCKQRFINKIANKNFWHKLYCRLHPNLINQHRYIWLKHIKTDYIKCLSCCNITTNICIKLFQCIIYPICPCLRNNTTDIEPELTSPYIDKYGDNDTSNDVSLKIGYMLSNSKSASKSIQNKKSRIAKSKLHANMFSNTRQVEKRLDLEILGDHESSDSEIKQYIEKETRGQRMRTRNVNR